MLKVKNKSLNIKFYAKNRTFFITFDASLIFSAYLCKTGRRTRKERIKIPSM